MTGANDGAIEAAALAEAARLAKGDAADEPARHLMHLHGLMVMTDELFCTSLSERHGPTAAAPTPPVPFRSRGDCLGRPG